MKCIEIIVLLFFIATPVFALDVPFRDISQEKYYLDYKNKGGKNLYFNDIKSWAGG